MELRSTALDVIHHKQSTDYQKMQAAKVLLKRIIASDASAKQMSLEILNKLLKEVNWKVGRVGGCVWPFLQIKRPLTLLF